MLLNSNLFNIKILNSGECLQMYPNSKYKEKYKIPLWVLNNILVRKDSNKYKNVKRNIVHLMFSMILIKLKLIILLLLKTILYSVKKGLIWVNPCQDSFIKIYKIMLIPLFRILLIILSQVISLKDKKENPLILIKF